jgi:hypothetical protein
MSVFKENSRFSVLVEDSSNRKTNKKQDNSKDKKTNIIEEKKLNSVDDKPNVNSFKNENYIFNRRDGYNSRENNRRFYDNIEFEKKQKILEEERKEKERQKSLDMCNFPELVKTSIPIIEENTTNFLEKLKKNKNSEKLVEKKLEPGWTELRRDKKTNHTIMTFQPNKYKNEYIKTPQDLAYEVLDHLVYLHETRTANYIESWGYDEWENMFRFPNYDYQYFDKLDEIYLKNNPENDEEDEIDNICEEDDY